MIINHSSGFVFVHVPKAAGTSISRIFTAFSTYRDLEVGGTPMGETVQPYTKRRYGLAKHSTAAEIREVMGEQRWGKYFTFAFVRNPYTRAYSTFNYLHRQIDRKQLKTLKAVRGLSEFGEFLRSEYFAGDGMDRILRPQTFWTELPVGHKLRFIGSVEAIDTDIASALKEVGKPGGKKGKKQKGDHVPERNRSTTDPDELWKLLRADPEGERLIYERYQDDFKAYGYQRLDITSAQPYDERRERDQQAAPKEAQLAD